MAVIKIPKPRTLQCKHVHVSGNRCESRIEVTPKHRGPAWCEPHTGKFEKCTECYAMLRAFQPPHGW